MINLVNVKIFEAHERFSFKSYHTKEDLKVDTMYVLSTKDSSILNPILDIIKIEKIETSSKNFLIKIHNEDDYISSPHEYLIEFDELGNVKEFQLGCKNFQSFTNKINGVI